MTGLQGPLRNHGFIPSAAGSAAGRKAAVRMPLGFLSYRATAFPSEVPMQRPMGVGTPRPAPTPQLAQLCRAIPVGSLSFPTGLHCGSTSPYSQSCLLPSSPQGSQENCPINLWNATLSQDPFPGQASASPGPLASDCESWLTSPPHPQPGSRPALPRCGLRSTHAPQTCCCPPPRPLESRSHPRCPQHKEPDPPSGAPSPPQGCSALKPQGSLRAPPFSQPKGPHLTPPLLPEPPGQPP